MTRHATPSRVPPKRGWGAFGRLRTLLYRYQGLRWVAAAGAALVVFVTLSDQDSGDSCIVADVAAESPGPQAPLADDARGVPVPADTATLAVGDSVDVHAVIDGAVIVRSAAVSRVTESRAVVAVPVERAETVVEALTTGGVILVLAP